MAALGRYLEVVRDLIEAEGATRRVLHRLLHTRLRPLLVLFSL